MKRVFLLLLIQALLPLWGQEPREVEVRTLCFRYSAGLKEVTLSGDVDGVSQVKCDLKKYLDVNQQKMTLIGNEIRVGEPRDGGFESWGKVGIKKSLKEILLVFFPSEDAEAPYHIVAFDDSAKGFPLGSFLIANINPEPLRLVIGEQKIQINSGTSELVSDLKNVRANGQVPYYAYVKEGDDWKRLSSGFWTVVKRKRNFQVAFRNTKTKRVDLRGYDDTFPIFKDLLRKQENAQR